MKRLMLLAVMFCAAMQIMAHTGVNERPKLVVVALL